MFGSRRSVTASSRGSGSTRAQPTPARTSGRCGSTGARGSRTVTFTNETATGWQTALFRLPVSVVAGQQYTVSYTAPNGGYAYRSTTGRTTGGLLAPSPSRQGVGAAAPGVFGNPGTLPTTSVQRDELLRRRRSSTRRTPRRCGIIVADPDCRRHPASRSTAPVTATLHAACSAATVIVTVKDADGTAGTRNRFRTRRLARTAKFVADGPSPPRRPYTRNASRRRLRGRRIRADGNGWTLHDRPTTSWSATCPCSLFTESCAPVASTRRLGCVTVGVRVLQRRGRDRSPRCRFYKGTANTGTTRRHAVELGRAAALATVTFTDESTTGWQTATFSHAGDR